MYPNQSFGGANRGPSSERQRSKRSNIFVDLGFIALAVSCAAVVGFQYSPLLATSGYNVASGHLTRIGFPRRYDDYSTYRSRRGSWVTMLQADFNYTTGGKAYHSTVTSVPIIGLISIGALSLADETDKNGLAVRYDASDPQKCVPVEVIDCFTKTALGSYICVFIVGMLLLSLAGLSNLSNDTWRPGQRTDAY